MRLSRRSEYACLALIDLTEHYEEGYVKTGDIAQRMDIPRKYLEQILLALKGAGYVQSARGTEGGYRLARPPSKISVAEIIRLLDGAIAPVGSASKYFHEHTPIERSTGLINLFREIRDYTANKLEATSFADLV